MISFFNNYIDRKNAYSFSNRWKIDAPLEASWNELLSYEKWPGWCDALETITPLGQFDRLKPGNHVRSVWKGMFPYRVCFDARIVAVVPCSFLSFTVTGDLCGDGVCYFGESNGKTTIRFLWNVFPTRFWMRMSSPFARSLFIGNHDFIIKEVVKGFTRRMDQKQTKQAQKIPHR